MFWPVHTIPVLPGLIDVLLSWMRLALAPTLVILRNLVGSNTLLFFAPCTVFQPPSSTRGTPEDEKQSLPQLIPLLWLAGSCSGTSFTLTWHNQLAACVLPEQPGHNSSHSFQGLLLEGMVPGWIPLHSCGCCTFMSSGKEQMRCLPWPEPHSLHNSCSAWLVWHGAPQALPGSSPSPGVTFRIIKVYMYFLYNLFSKHFHLTILSIEESPKLLSPCSGLSQSSFSQSP